MHRSRLCALLIDCDTPDVGQAADFWAQALGRPPTGQRFCVVRVQRPDFPTNATTWE